MADDLVVRFATQEDKEALSRLIGDVFVHTEILNNACIKAGSASADDFASIVELARETAGNGFTALAEVGGQVVGCRLATVQSREEYTNTHYPDPVQPIMHALHASMSEPIKADRVLHLEASAVRPELQGRGIAGRMLDVQLEKCRQEGIKCLVSEATGLYSQALLVKRGFKCISEVNYAEFTRDGKLLYPDTGVHKSLKLLVYYL